MADSIIFLNKYRVPSCRLSGWDYSSSGYYFVTVCTKDRICWFGEIENGRIILSEIGKIINEEWRETSKIRKNVVLDEWGIMPNHLHGIIIIKNTVETPRRDVEMGVETPRRGVSTVNKWKPNTLGAILNQFKSVCTKKIENIGFRDFCWQSRFYDHVIRNERSLQEIRDYIFNNPLKWDEDKNNPKNGENI